MRKSLAATLVVGALVFGLALGSVGIAYAQADDAAVDDRGRGGFIEFVTDLLGITEDEFIEAKQDGQSLPRIAEDAGVELDTIADAMIAEQTERLDTLLADDSITQEQYDWALENMADKVEERLLSDGLRGPGMRGPGGPGQRGPGMHEGGEAGPRGHFGEAGACEIAPDDVPAAPEA